MVTSFIFINNKQQKSLGNFPGLFFKKTIFDTNNFSFIQQSNNYNE